jgi:hypothetical protein
MRVLVRDTEFDARVQEGVKVASPRLQVYLPTGSGTYSQLVDSAPHRSS